MTLFLDLLQQLSGHLVTPVSTIQIFTDCFMIIIAKFGATLTTQSTRGFFVSMFYFVVEKRVAFMCIYVVQRTSIREQEHVIILRKKRATSENSITIAPSHEIMVLFHPP